MMGSFVVAAGVAAVKFISGAAAKAAVDAQIITKIRTP